MQGLGFKQRVHYIKGRALRLTGLRHSGSLRGLCWGQLSAHTCAACLPPLAHPQEFKMLIMQFESAYEMLRPQVSSQCSVAHVLLQCDMSAPWFCL